MPLKTSTCADIQRAGNQEYEIQATHLALPGRLPEPSLQHGPRYGISWRFVASASSSKCISGADVSGCVTSPRGRSDQLTGLPGQETRPAPPDSRYVTTARTRRWVAPSSRSPSLPKIDRICVSTVRSDSLSATLIA